MISQLSVTIALVASTFAAPALLTRPGHSDNFFAIHRRAASPEVQQQNGLAAQAQNKAFAALNANSSCTTGEDACVGGAFAQCVGSKFELTQCSQGLSCFALPLLNSNGTSLSCDTEADVVARMEAVGVPGGIDGSGAGTNATTNSTTNAPMTSGNTGESTSHCGDDTNTSKDTKEAAVSSPAAASVALGTGTVVVPSATGSSAPGTVTAGSPSLVTPSPVPVASAQKEDERTTSTIILDFPGETLPGFLTPDQIESIFSSLSASAASVSSLATAEAAPLVSGTNVFTFNARSVITAAPVPTARALHRRQILLTAASEASEASETDSSDAPETTAPDATIIVGHTGDPGFETPEEVSSFLASQASAISATFTPSLLRPQILDVFIPPAVATPAPVAPALRRRQILSGPIVGESSPAPVASAASATSTSATDGTSATSVSAANAGTSSGASTSSTVSASSVSVVSSTTSATTSVTGATSGVVTVTVTSTMFLVVEPTGTVTAVLSTGSATTSATSSSSVSTTSSISASSTTSSTTASSTTSSTILLTPASAATSSSSSSTSTSAAASSTTSASGFTFTGTGFGKRLESLARVRGRRAF